MDRLQAIRSLAGGDPSALVNDAIRRNVMCTFPNGQTMTAAQVADAIRGKSPQQTFEMFGIDTGQAMEALEALRAK